MDVNNGERDRLLEELANLGRYDDNPYTFHSIWIRQLQAQRERGYDFKAMSRKERVEYIKKHVLYMIVELGEFLNELPDFKEWKVYPKDAKLLSDAAEEEFADVVHFFLNICIAAGIDDILLCALYMMKHDKNMERLADTAHYRKDVPDEHTTGDGESAE